MEEDLELFNDNGLEGFGQLLGGALKGVITAPDSAGTADSTGTADSFFPLQLTYRYAGAAQV